MNHHDRWERWLLEDLEDELTGRRKARLKRHLESCPTCRRERERLRDLRGGLKELLAEVPPPRISDGAFLQRIVARATEETPRRVRIRWAAVTAVAVATLALVLWTAREPAEIPSERQVAESLLAADAEEVPSLLVSDLSEQDLVDLDASALLVEGAFPELLERDPAPVLLYPDEQVILSDLDQEELESFLRLLKEA